MDFLSESAIKDVLERARETLKEKFRDNIIGLVLYGSWAKGTAREDSDIDLIAVFNSVDNEIRRLLYEIERDIAKLKDITLVTATAEEFQKEKIPLYTAVKKEGKIIMGNVDFTLNPEPPHTKYAEYFEKSKE